MGSIHSGDQEQSQVPNSTQRSLTTRQERLVQSLVAEWPKSENVLRPNWYFLFLVGGGFATIFLASLPWFCHESFPSLSCCSKGWSCPGTPNRSSQPSSDRERRKEKERVGWKVLSWKGGEAYSAPPCARYVVLGPGLRGGRRWFWD